MNITENIYATLADLAGLSLFSELKDHPLFSALRNLLDDLASDEAFSEDDASLEIIHDWAVFTESFIRFERGYSFYLTVGFLALTDDNPYTHAAEMETNLPPVLLAVAKTDLSRLGRIASFPIHGLGFHIAELLRKSSLEQLAQNIEEESRVFWAAEGKKGQAEGAEKLLGIFPENSNWGAALPALTEYLHRYGAGLLGLYSAFYWTGSAPIFSGNEFGEDAPNPEASAFYLTPIPNPDPVRFEDLALYEEQRSVVAANTLRLLEGKPANNLLLYGDRGTGKSATVKAVCNEYAGRGLKLLEIRKPNLFQLSSILQILGARSRCFIIFIDDLSFESADDSFLALKALLEGSAETRPANTAIYATSNRRHLVTERTAGPPGTLSLEPRAIDTMQEQLSLADRFGLTVVFSAPSQEEYLRIACFIAARRGLFQGETDPEAAMVRFQENAIRWERWFNGRSPRTAVQYVDWVLGGAGFPWE